MEKIKEMRQLKYIFTETEKKDLADKMARSVLEREDAQNELKSLKSQFDSKIKSAEAEITGTAEKLRSGYEYRYIECEVEKNFEEGSVVVTRLDTFEVIENRKLTGAERQMTINN